MNRTKYFVAVIYKCCCDWEV